MTTSGRDQPAGEGSDGEGAAPADGRRSGEGASTALEALIRKRKQATIPADPLDPALPQGDPAPAPPVPPALPALP